MRRESTMRRIARRATLAVSEIGPVRAAVFQMLTVRQASIDGGLAQAELPSDVTGFEDVAFLFSSNLFNYRIAALRLDEAAYLWKVARSLPRDAVVAELGRFQGGSTLLFAAAAQEAEIHSYDLPVRYGLDGAALDAQLLDAVERLGLDATRMHLAVGDSASAELPARPCHLVFVDGDHTYEGVRADYLHWRDAVAPGGHLVFHDAVIADRLIGTEEDGVARAVGEVERDDPRLTRALGAGTLAHFTRR
jgi:predicted O-methyltransferase YrrM